jgi:hypothetical protein
MEKKETPPLHSRDDLQVKSGPDSDTSFMCAGMELAALLSPLINPCVLGWKKLNIVTV